MSVAQACQPACFQKGVFGFVLFVKVAVDVTEDEDGVFVVLCSVGFADTVAEVELDRRFVVWCDAAGGEACGRVCG